MGAAACRSSVRNAAVPAATSLWPMILASLSQAQQLCLRSVLDRRFRIFFFFKRSASSEIKLTEALLFLESLNKFFFFKI